MKKFILAFIGVFLILSSTIPIKAEELNEKIILIDPGHGGIDGGAISKNGTVEKDINLDIALKLRESLEDKGYKVDIDEKPLIIQLKNDIAAFAGKLELNAAGKNLKNNTNYKAIVKKNNVYNIPDGLKKYSPIISDDQIRFLGSK